MKTYSYPKWNPRYSNEDFDRIQAFACEIARDQNPNARGYTRESFDLAKKLVHEAIDITISYNLKK